MMLRARLQDLPIRHKLHLAILGTTSLAMLLAGIAFVAVQWRLSAQSVQQDLNTLAQLMATNSTAAISFHDEGAAHQILASLQARPHVLMACLFTSANPQQALASYSRADQDHECKAEYRQSLGSPGQLRGSAEVIFSGEVLGQLVIIESDAGLWLAFRRNLSYLSVILTACLLLALLLSSWLQSLIAGPLIQLAKITSEISESGNFSLRASEFGKDETGRLVTSFNRMLDKIEQAETQLRDLNFDLQGQVRERNKTNISLQQTLDQLRAAQAQLVQTEKMASLGGLVAGVAHEINTPVGIGVTAASTLLAKVEELRNDFEQEVLTESGLRSFMELARQSSEIIAANLERAANLIQSFKQVAVDQSSLEHREFVVGDYIGEVMLSLQPKLKHTRIKVALDCPDGFRIDSYPGLISQILTNLVMNALIHAYGPKDEGQISIRVQPSRAGMRLEFSDDGRGMSADNLQRVFDPFFTTRRGDGGSGLGLHIVFNLVTQQLGGQIHVESQPGQGTRFEIDISRHQEEREHDIAKAS